MKFTKPALSYQGQAALLLSRGLVVTDHAAFMRQLEAVGFYRLCSYWHPFKQAQQPDSPFVAGTRFDVVWARYAFDRHLRLAVMDAVERVEIAVRTALVTELCMAHGPFAHLDPANFPHAHPTTHSKFLDKLREEAEGSKETFVAQFRATYDEFPDLPLWAAAETMTFGLLFTLFRMSPRRIQDNVANRYGIRGPVLYSWLQTLNYVRNICAHHARLWNRELAIKPTLPVLKNGPEWYSPVAIQTNRVFVVLTILNFLMRKIAPQSQWRTRLFDLVDRYPDAPSTDMGIHEGWRGHSLWL